MRWIIALPLLFVMGCKTTTKPLLLTTDFGLKDGAVSEMRGVAYQVSPTLLVSDLTHEIPPYSIWQASYRLAQTYKYWPAGSVFVTVVDPGVGSARRSIVLRTKSGHYFVGPDNGHLTLIADEAGIESVRVIDESKQRRRGSEESYTFHGRDIYVYVGARLASGELKYDELTETKNNEIVRLNYQRAEIKDGHLVGMLPALDPNYGNVWTNLSKAMVLKHIGEKRELHVTIHQGTKKIFEGKIPLVETFAAVPTGKPLAYFNSLLNLSFALNMDDFAKRYKIQSGPEWRVSVD